MAALLVSLLRSISVVTGAYPEMPLFTHFCYRQDDSN